MRFEYTLNQVALYTDRERVRSVGMPYIDLRPDFQRDYEAWDNKLRTRLVETAFLERAMNPVWLVPNTDADGEDIYEVLDGMHRCTTLINFLSGEFCINGRYLTSLPQEKYDGKFFKDLDRDDKEKVRNYSISFNLLDRSFREDMDKLQDQFDILNRSSRQLNHYEFNKPLYKPVYDIVKTAAHDFCCTAVHPSRTSKRGSVESDALHMLALTEPTVPRTISSVVAVTEDWMKTTFGTTKKSIDDNVARLGPVLEERYQRLCRYQADLAEGGAFEGTRDTLVAKMMVARCAAKYVNAAAFRRAIPKLAPAFRDILGRVDRIQKEELDCNHRNGTFQRRLMLHLDEVIDGVPSAPRRLFPKEMIEKKKAEQHDRCALCQETIAAGQNYEGDHIEAWGKGGDTTYDNLQVVHARCHRFR